MTGCRRSSAEISGRQGAETRHETERHETTRAQQEVSASQGLAGQLQRDEGAGRPPKRVSQYSDDFDELVVEATLHATEAARTPAAGSRHVHAATAAEAYSNVGELKGKGTGP